MLDVLVVGWGTCRENKQGHDSNPEVSAKRWDWSPVSQQLVLDFSHHHIRPLLATKSIQFIYIEESSFIPEDVKGKVKHDIEMSEEN